MPRDDLLLAEMIDAAEQAVALVSGKSVDDLEADRTLRDALLWNFTVLGEAAAQLSGELRARYPDIAWESPSRLRNRIVHGYWSIDLEIIDNTARDQLPEFVTRLREVVEAEATR